MSAVTLSQPPTVRYEADNPRKLEALEQFIELGQGSFYFAPVQFDLPSLQNEVLGKLHEKSPHLNLVTVRLTPPPADAPRAYHVLDQLRDLVRLESPDRAPDALIITNYESLFPEAVKADDGRITEELVRAIQPLNLGRNLFAEAFPCPVLLCLPPTAMGVFLRSAPDLVSWKSGFFQFESDAEAIRAELEQEAGKPLNWLTRWQLRRRTPEELFAETKRLEALIADAEAMPAGSLPDANRLIARLYHQLGWTAVAFKDRLQARWAFAEMLRRAKEADDQRLIGAAEWGHRAAEAVTTVARLSPEQSAAVQEVLRGAAALGESEGLYGREDELRELVSRVTRVETRFLIVWGETGCGKTSLALAGLLPEINRQGHYLPVVARQWEEPEAAIRHALAQTSGLALESFETLHDCIGHVARQTQETVVVVCDQFEQFFTTHPQRSARQPLVKAISACVNDLRIPCKFLFILHEDHLGRMVEFESDVPEAIEQRKRFYLPLFNAADAIRVLRQQADKARLDWPENFVRAVVSDLTHEERVRPIELQLVGAALAVAGIGNESDFAREGRAQGLMVEYLRLTLNSLGQSQGSVRTMKQILLALVAEPAARLALTPEKIARRAAVNLGEVRRLLNPLLATHLIRRVEDSNVEVSAVDDANTRYELTHDVLVELVLILTRDLQDKRRQANRILTRALEDLIANPRHTIGLRAWKLVRAHGDESVLSRPKAKSLLRRSLIWGLTKLSIAFIILLTVANTTFYFARPLEYGRFLMNIGLKDAACSCFLKAIRDGHAGADYALLIMVKSDRRFASKMLTPLLVMLRDRTKFDGSKRREAADMLGEIAQADAALGGEVLDPLLSALNYRNEPDDDVHYGAARALGKVAQADHTLASRVLDSLLDVLNYRSEPDAEVRDSAAAALGKVAQADAKLAGRVLDSLLNLLKEPGDRNRSVRSAAVAVLGEVAQADATLADRVLDPLLAPIEDRYDYYNSMRRAVAAALGDIAQADARLAGKVLAPLLVALNYRVDYHGVARGAAAASLGKVVQADARLAREVINPLLAAFEYRNDSYNDVRIAAAAALGKAAQADATLASKVLSPLLAALKKSNEPDDDMRRAAAAALGEVARVEPKIRDQIFRLLTDPDGYVSDGVRDSLAELLFDLAAEEKKNGRDQLQFFFDHLEARRSLMPNGDSNTHAVYRNVVVGAMARWLVSDKLEAKATQASLKQRLEQMRDTDKRLHLRIAAWKVFVEAAELRENRQRGED